MHSADAWGDGCSLSDAITDFRPGILRTDPTQESVGKGVDTVQMVDEENLLSILVGASPVAWRLRVNSWKKLWSPRLLTSSRYCIRFHTYKKTKNLAGMKQAIITVLLSYWLRACMKNRQNILPQQARSIVHFKRKFSNPHLSSLQSFHPKVQSVLRSEIRAERSMKRIDICRSADLIAQVFAWKDTNLSILDCVILCLTSLGPRSIQNYDWSSILDIPHASRPWNVHSSSHRFSISNRLS